QTPGHSRPYCRGRRCARGHRGAHPAPGLRHRVRRRRPGYAPLSLAVDAGSGVAYVGRQDGAVTLLSTRTGRALRTLPASTGRPGAVSVAVAEGLGRVYLAHGYTWVGIPGNELDILDARRQTLLYRRRVHNLAG